MGEVLHVGALGAAGLGACCVALDGPRPRVRELLLSLVMLAAMVDIVTGASVLPVVGWSALVTMLAMALAVRRRRMPEPAALSRMRVSSAIGAVLMSALMLVMSAGPSAGGVHHGASASLLVALVGGASVAYAGFAIPQMRTGHALERMQYGSMAAAQLLLTGALML